MDVDQPQQDVPQATPEAAPDILLYSGQFSIALAQVRKNRRLDMKNRKMSVAVPTALVVSFLCAGCGSGIKVTKVPTSPGALTGVPWTLSMTQFTLVVSREVTGCTDTLKGKVSVQITAGKAPDPEQRYMLDSTGWFSTSDITSNLAADGSSTGLNASSQDQTGPILTSLATTAAQIAVGAIALGAHAAPQDHNAENAPTPTKFTCSDKVSKALAALHPYDKPSLQQRVTAETKALSQATDKVTLLTAQATKDYSYKKALAAALGVQDKAQTELTADQNALAAARKVVTETQTLLWPSTGSDFNQTNCNHLLAATLGKWIQSTAGNDTTPIPPDTTLFDISVAIYVPAQDGGWQFATSTQTADPTIGVPVRTAAPGRLSVCSGKGPCQSYLPPGWVADKTVTVKDQPMLQLGQMYNVRAAGGAFKSEGAVINLDTNGAPSSIEVSEKAAAAAVAASSAAAAATTFAGIPNAIAASQLAQGQAESAQITAQTAQITYQANLPTAALTARDQAQSALDNSTVALAAARDNARNAGPAAAIAAQTSLLTAQNSLAALEAGEPDVSQEDAWSAQTALNNSQASLINAQVALTKAKSTLP